MLLVGGRCVVFCQALPTNVPEPLRTLSMTIIPEPSYDNPTSFRRHSEEQPKHVRPFQRNPTVKSFRRLAETPRLSDDPPKTNHLWFYLHRPFRLSPSKPTISPPNPWISRTTRLEERKCLREENGLD